MRNAAHTIWEELGGVVAFMAVIWGVFAVSRFFPVVDQYGVVPRTLGGLAGIPAMPFLHENLHHILGNTCPLFVLLALLAGSRARSWEVVVEIVLLGGFLLWLFGRQAIHIGASGLVFGLIVFLILSGLREKRPVPLAIALLVGFLYGGTLVFGVLPSVGSQISWDGHLCCAVAGGIVAYTLTGQPENRGTDSPDSPLR